jgi:hypothetical protein
MALSPLWLAFKTVGEGLSANAGYRLAREHGIPVRRQTFLRMVGEVRNHYAQVVAEVARPLNRRPNATEITPLTAKKARGYIQYVDLFVRNKTTGQISVRPQAIRSSRLRSRQAVVDMAVSRYRGAVDRSKTAPAAWGTDPDEVVEGGVYAATQQFVPEE